jgi:c-di-GMP-binding flagellar brake protein YcgR
MGLRFASVREWREREIERTIMLREREGEREREREEREYGIGSKFFGKVAQ